VSEQVIALPPVLSICFKRENVGIKIFQLNGIFELGTCDACSLFEKAAMLLEGEAFFLFLRRFSFPKRSGLALSMVSGIRNPAPGMGEEKVARSNPVKIS